MVGDRLIHIVAESDNASSHCGTDCSGHGHASGPAVMDHGRLNIARNRLAADAGTDGASSSASNGTGPSAETTRASKASAIPRSAIGGGRYQPLVAPASVVVGDDAAAANKKNPDATAPRGKGSTPTEDLTSVEGMHLALTIEHAGGAEVSTHTRLKVSGICCPSEVPLIHSILDRMPGVRAVKVIVPTKTVLVEHAAIAAPTASIIDALNAARLQASLASANAAPAGGGADASDLNKCCGGNVAGNLPPPAILLACFLLAISLFHYMGGDAEHLRWVALGAVVVGIPGIALKAVGSLRNGVVDINTLMTVAVGGAVALQDFGEAAAVVALFGVSEWLEERAMGRASTAMGAVMALRPESATRLSHPDVSVPVEEVAVGEVVLVKPGEKVPLDGIVVGGSSAVDEAALTGESVPVPKGVGATVFGGTVNQGGQLEVRVTAPAADSAVARLVRLVEEAQAARSNVERMVETFAKHYTPVVIVAAVLLATIPFALGHRGLDYVYKACVLLVVACPCALVLSTPVVAVCGLTRAARRGMLVKGSAYLERLGRLQTICVDKTGTLTEGRFALVEAQLATPRVTGAKARPALGAGALLRWACALEARASHPVAAAVLAGSGAAVRIAAKQCKVVDFETLPGEGARAMVDGKLVEIGGPALAKRRGWVAADPALGAATAAWEVGGATAIWVGVDGDVAGALRCEDALRTTAAGAVEKLRKMGCEVIMLTGDNHGSALRVAAATGIPPADVHAGLSPANKMQDVVARVAQLEARAGGTGSLRRRFVGRGTLAMVGDGINDAPALGAADVGIAMGVAGAAAAMETADVALLTNDLSRVAETIAIGRLCLTKIRQNIIFSIVTKAIVLVLSLMGYTGLWEAVVFDVGTALAVILNGMTVLKAGPEEKAAMAPEGGVKTAHSHAPSHAHSHGGKQCAGDHFKTEAAAKKALGVGVRSAASGDALELAEQGAGGAPAPVHGHGHSHAAAAKDKQVSSHNNLSKPPPPPPAQALVKKDSCQTKKC